MRKMTGKPLKAAAFLAAFMLTAGLMPALQKSEILSEPLTACAEDKDYTEGESGPLSYKKYSDHIVIWGVKDVTDLEIPASIDGLPVTHIDIYTCECNTVSSITFPDTLVEIGPYAFSMLENLRSVTFPDSLKKIGFQAFKDCPNLTEINFPDHLVETGDYTFEGSPWLEAQRKKDPLVIINGAVIDGRTCEGEVTIPSSVKYVASGAFAKNEKITSVVFPSSVTAIQDNMFWYCPNLTSVELNGSTSLGMFVFAACNKLTDIKLSGKLTKIDGYAFADNTATSTITFYGSRDTWERVEKPDNDPFLQRATIIFDENHQEQDEEVAGDVNMDGVFDTADAVLIHKWLLTVPDAELKNWKAGDFNGDEKLDAGDLSMMKAALLAKR